MFMVLLYTVQQAASRAFFLSTYHHNAGSLYFRQWMTTLWTFEPFPAPTASFSPPSEVSEVAQCYILPLDLSAGYHFLKQPHQLVCSGLGCWTS